MRKPGEFRFKPPRWQRWSYVGMAAFYGISAFFDDDNFFWVAAVGWTVLTAVGWLALATVVDDRGIGTPGGRWGRFYAWDDVQRFGTWRDGKPKMVMRDGKAARLPYVPAAAYLQLQERWLAHRQTEKTPAGGVGDSNE